MASSWRMGKRLGWTIKMCYKLIVISLSLNRTFPHTRTLLVFRSTCVRLCVLCCSVVWYYYIRENTLPYLLLWGWCPGKLVLGELGGLAEWRVEQ